MVSGRILTTDAPAPPAPAPAAPTAFDDLVIGAGMAGLTVAALLARDGRRVGVVEAHDTPGGYAHTFGVGAYRFCAQVHYIFGCEEGGPVRRLLRALDLESEVRMLPLDSDGYDHVVVAGDRFRIPNGFERFRDRAAAHFPEHATAIRRYFELLIETRRELELLPEQVGFLDLIRAPFLFPELLRHRKDTLGQVFDRFGLPARVRAVLAGQAGDYLLPPSQVSFLLHTALTAGYDRGAWYPERHYGHFIDKIVERIRSAPGCDVALGVEVADIRVQAGRVLGVRDTAGREWTGGRVISNIDPARTAALIHGDELPDRWLHKLHYDYSCGSFTVYMGLSGLDLRAHGFGNWNLWHYPHADLEGAYAAQVDRADLSDPWLFVSTPSLHSRAPGLAPPDHEVLVAATACNYAHFRQLKDHDPHEYSRQKVKIRDRILDILEERYIPGLRAHLDLKVAGTPATNERFCWSPQGNAYGAALTPANVSLSRLPFETPLHNLFLVNATAGYPSVAGTVRSGQRLFALLTGGEA